jgi:hypothetical protein
MDIAKTLATALGINRALFGANYLMRPDQARTSWIGRAARKPGARVMIRSQGARDVALGGGALRAVVRGDAPELRAWMVAHTVSDLADLAATWVARKNLPTRRARFAMTIAGISVVVGGAATVASRGDRVAGS